MLNSFPDILQSWIIPYHLTSLQLSPAYLHTNSTSHVWPFSAIAELIDNAYDPDVSASQLRIDVEEIDGQTCLTFLDNGMLLWVWGGH